MSKLVWHRFVCILGGLRYLLFKIECEGDDFASAFFHTVGIHEAVSHAWILEPVSMLGVKTVRQSIAEFKLWAQFEKR